MSKNILQGHEARLKIKAGIDKAADAVRPTLGAVGMTAMIEFNGLDPLEADDGVTILRNLDFKDHYENIGLQMLRKGALRTSTEGGDGTATTTVLTQALVAEAVKEIGQDSSRIREVRERLDAGLAEVLQQLSTIKHEVTEDDIEKIATISSLDAEVAKLIAEVIKEIGVNGVVTVEQGAKIGYSKEVVKGARFDSGLISPYFVNQPDQTCVLNDPYIAIIDRRVSTNEQILGLLNTIGTGKDILFIADAVDSVALATLVHNHVNKIANIACVTNPYTASRAKEFLFDMASLTGATVISEEKGMKLDEATASLCGHAEKVVVTKGTTTIIGGKSDARLEQRIEDIQGQIDNSTSEYEKIMLEDRLASLTGGIGVIRVGAYTDTEFNAKKYKFVNAINSTQSALQEGIVAGGGVAMASIIYKLKEPIFQSALCAPIRQMATNAGMFDERLPWQKRSSDQLLSSALFTFDVMRKGESGINFKTKETVNMFDVGIIDPYKVQRIALESATAITKSLIGVETVITEADEEKKM